MRGHHTLTLYFAIRHTYLGKVSFSVNNLPLDLVHAESVPFKESFVLFGGLFYEDLQPLDTILHYIPSNDTWVEMNVRLRTPRGYTTVIPVKRSIFPPC